MRNSKIIAIVLMIVMVATVIFGCSSTVEAAGNKEVKLRINYNYVDLQGEPSPFINANGRTMVPIRLISTNLGAETDYDNDTKTVTVTKGQKVIKLVIGQNKATVNGNSVNLDTSSSLVNDRTFVPVRFISETFGCYIDYSSYYNTVSIYVPEALSREDIQRLRSYPIKAGHPRNITIDMSYDDSNVYMFEPALTSIDENLLTREGAYKDTVDSYKRSIEYSNLYYNFDYRNTNEYKTQLYRIFNDTNAHATINGKIEPVSKWIDSNIESLKAQKLICEAQFIPDMSLIYCSRILNYQMRGILRYRVTNTTNNWFFGANQQIDYGVWYERDVECEVYNSLMGGTDYKKFRNPVFLSAAKESNR